MMIQIPLVGLPADATAEQVKAEAERVMNNLRENAEKALAPLDEVGQLVVRAMLNVENSGETPSYDARLSLLGYATNMLLEAITKTCGDAQRDVWNKAHAEYNRLLQEAVLAVQKSSATIN